MGIFSSLFKRKEKPKRQDPVFGEIQYDDDPIFNHWLHIPSLSGRYMLSIEASEAGPSDAQRDFFNGFENNKERYLSQSLSFMVSYGFQKDKVQDMSIYALEIGKDGELLQKNFTVELSDSDAHEIHRVTFENDEPVGYVVDD